MRDGNVSAAIAAVPSTFRSSVELQISPPPPPQRQLQPRPSPSPLPSTSSGQRSNFSTSQPPMPRMQVSLIFVDFRARIFFYFHIKQLEIGNHRNHSLQDLNMYILINKMYKPITFIPLYLIAHWFQQKTSTKR